MLLVDKSFLFFFTIFLRCYFITPQKGVNMEIDQLVKQCMAQKGTWEDRPFGPEHIVMKVGKKLYAIISDETGLRINLKCEPDFVLTLVDQYDNITLGYHMNKKHWITFIVTEDADLNLLKQLVEDSYNLVFKSLTKREQREIVK